MIKNFKILIIFTLVYFNFQSFSKSDEFFFEGNEIEILNNGNRLLSKEKVKITSTDNLIITSNEFDYDKIKSELILKGNVIINDQNNKTIINTEEIKYFRNLEKLLSEGDTAIRIENNYIINSKNITFLRKKKEITSDYTTTVSDKYGNNFSSEKFLFLVKDKILKGRNVSLKDIDGNRSFFESFFGNLSKKDFYGKDVKVLFENQTFGNKNNEPRLYGNTLKTNKNETIITKGIFTTCKKRDKCPPWTIKAKEVIHDKEKKVINYKDAWLQIYDKPIIYFPKFFHPDPTVKRQSGFLIPKFSESGNTGSSFQIPYFKVLDIDKDLTFTPTIFADKNLILQNEYREVGKKFDTTIDFGLFTSELSNSGETSKSHFFSNTAMNFDSSFFEKSSLKLNLEQVSNDTYLKKYKINSPIIKSETLMHSYIEYFAYNDDTSVNFSLETYEDLTKKKSDRFEIIYPNIDFSKDIEQYFNLNGNLNLSSNIYQKKYDTNIYKQSFINDLLFSSTSNIGITGFLNDYKLLIKNVNEKFETGSNDQSTSTNKFLSKIMYNLSYPLKKESQLYDSFIKPTASLRLSPNKTKNISSSDRRIDINNINSFNRLAVSDGVEGGQSLTLGLEYKLKNKLDEDKITIDIAQVYSDTANPDLPKSSTLDKKYSDLIGRLKFNLIDNLNLEYNFILDNDLKKSNYDSIIAGIDVNNFVTNFEYLEEKGEIGTVNYIGNQTSYKFDVNNSLSFSTRRNKELDLTEFYNLMYQYENDCLKAAIEYNKTFYNDSDLKPEEELFFTLTIVPFSKFNTTNFKN